MLFSKLDLTKGFWQIPLDEASKAILAMSTPLGLMEPNHMPFGMKNAPAVFQREMQRVLREKLGKGVMVFIDDILLHTKTVEEHEELVRWVLKRLCEEGYYANPDKCEFFQKEVSFLGHVIDEKGISVQQHKVKAVSAWPVPKNTKEVKGFLGLTNYYRKFVHQYNDIAVPLTEMTKKPKKTSEQKQTPTPAFVWGPAQQKAFDALKARLVSAPILAHPDLWSSVPTQHRRLGLCHRSGAESAADRRQREARSLLQLQDGPSREELPSAAAGAAGHRQGSAPLAVLPGRQPPPCEDLHRSPGAAVAQHPGGVEWQAGEVGRGAVRLRVPGRVRTRTSERRGRRPVEASRPAAR